MVYAILENNICTSICEREKLPDGDVVVLDKIDISYLGRTYKNGKWSEPIKQPEPITMEQLQANQLDMMDAIADLYLMQDDGGATV